MEPEVNDHDATLSTRTPFRFLGFDLTPEFAMKLLALVFALGILFQKLSTIEEKLTEKINTQSNIMQLKMDTLEWRMQRLENAVNKP